MRASLSALLVTAILCLFLSACVSRESIYRVESTALVERIGNSGAEEPFREEFNSLLSTLSSAENALAEGNIDLADQYYLLLLGKGTVLEQRLLAEVKLRKEEAVRQEEQRRIAEQEIKLEIMREQELEREKARERAVAEAKRIEAARFEARSKAEKLKADREVQLAQKHTVKRGETLPQIAAKAEVYGDSSLWPLLYKANRDQISDPGILWPGQVLRIPRNHDKGDMSDARRFAAERPLR